VGARLLLSACWLGSLVVAAGACDRPPPDLREWKPTDHDRADEQNPTRAAQPRAQSSAGGNPTTMLAEITWRNQCAACHGAAGRGDGPQGPMVRAPDLTSAQWQSKVTDEQIGQVIQSGKNKMPRFDLPANVLTGLVARIRAARGK
jgi:mono/diheme cytochrome c family protein